MKIWLPSICLIVEKFTKKDKEKIRSLLKRISLISDEQRDSYDFFIKKGNLLGLELKEDLGCFIVSINDVRYDKNELEKSDLIVNWRVKPAAYIEFNVTNNHQIHYQFIALLALELHKFLGGYFSLSEIIISSNQEELKDRFTQKIIDIDMNMLQSIKGEIYEIHSSFERYESANHYCICTAEWLQNWLQCNDFHLAK